jgi:hypothetical protein
MKLRIALFATIVSAIVVACTEDDPSRAALDATDAGPTADATPVVAPDGALPAADASIPPPPPTGEEDGGLIADGGGGNPDEDLDAGTTGDAGIDGGSCGPPSGGGAMVQSNCSGIAAIPIGGTITPGIYDLAGFTVENTLANCAAYSPSSYSGRLDITANGGGGFILAERVEKTGGINFFPNKSFVATASGSTLNVTQACGVTIAATSWKYTAMTANGKPVILYNHPSGTAMVRYRWVLR